MPEQIPATFASRTLWNIGWRYLLRHPWQSALMVLGITLGVAVAVAVDLANASATRAFDYSTDSVAGRATHQIVAGPQGLDEALYVTLRREGFSLLTPAYALEADWDNVAAIGVEEGPPKPGLLILFEDVEAVLRTAKPRRRGKGGFSVPALRADVQANFVAGGYHLQVPGNLLRWDADRIAHWMAQARSGEPWEETA